MSDISSIASFGGGAGGAAKMDIITGAGAVAAAFNNQQWTAKSFFSGPQIRAPEIVEFGVGKTYDFFA